MSPLVAHAGHWLVDLIYVAPLVLLGVFVLAGKVRAWLSGPRHKSRRVWRAPRRP